MILSAAPLYTTQLQAGLGLIDETKTLLDLWEPGMTAVQLEPLTPGARKQIALRMIPDFAGKFTVKALNPTTLSAYSSLDLETDYSV